MRDLARDSRTYELMIIISPDVSEEDLGPAVDRVSGYISDAGGAVQEILNESPWGRRRLAYPIRHAGRDMRDGFYAVYHFTLAPDNVQEIEREIKLNDQIMRYLVVQYKQPATPEPQPEAAATESAEAEAATPEATEAVPQAEAAEPAVTEAAAPAATEAEPATAEAAFAASDEPATEAAAAPAEEEAAATVPPAEPETAPEAAASEEAGATTTADEPEAAASAEEPAKED